MASTSIAHTAVAAERDAACKANLFIIKGQPGTSLIAAVVFLDCGGEQSDCGGERSDFAAQNGHATTQEGDDDGDQENANDHLAGINAPTKRTLNAPTTSDSSSTTCLLQDPKASSCGRR